MDHSSSLAADITSSGADGVTPAPSTVSRRRCGTGTGRRAQALAIWMQVAGIPLQRRADAQPAPAPADHPVGPPRTLALSPFPASCPLQILDHWTRQGRISPVAWEDVPLPTSPQVIFSVTAVTTTGWGRTYRSVVETATGASVAAARRAAATALITQLNSSGERHTR